MGKASLGKARCVAGDLQLGEDLLANLRPEFTTVGCHGPK